MAKTWLIGPGLDRGQQGRHGGDNALRSLNHRREYVACADATPVPQSAEAVRRRQRRDQS